MKWDSLKQGRYYKSSAVQETNEKNGTGEQILATYSYIHP